MTTIIALIAAITLAVVVLAMFYEMRKKLNALQAPAEDKNQEVLMSWLKDMRESQQRSTTDLRNDLDRTNRTISERLDNAAKVVQSVGTEVGKMSEIGNSMKELQQVLRSPKMRGNIGEQIMKDLLEQMLPKSGFKLQYKFHSGDTVDAVVKTKNGLIPLDSKFPLENFLLMQKTEGDERAVVAKVFQKDVKAHIDKIAKKYILPAEQTVDFAIMYVPGESVYYEIVTNTTLTDYGAGKKVYLVSPNTFHYFLRTILVAMEGEKIEERAQQVMIALQSIQHDSTKLGADLGVLNRHVTNAKNTMDSVNTSYSRLGGKINETGRLREAADKAEQPQIEMDLEPAAVPDAAAIEALDTEEKATEKTVR